MSETCEVHAILFAVKCLYMLARPTVVELDRLIIGRRYTKFTTIIIIDARDLAIWLNKLFEHLCGLERRHQLKRQRQWRL